MSVINTNISAIAAQNSLRATALNQQQAMERLSTGLRINNAKDDAAGLAISTRMTATIRGMAAAIRNANDGISLTQTAEGSLSSIQDNLQRIRELAVQSANSPNSSQDRTSLNNEAQSLIKEIDRVANNTTFNGVKLLDGSYTSQDFQIGSGNTSNDRISISITKVTAGGLGVAYFNTTSGTIASGTSSISANTIKINGVDIGAVAAGADQAGTLANTVAAINTVTGQTGISAAVSSGNIKFTSVKGDTSFTLSGTGATVANVGVAAGTITLTTDTNDTGLNAIDLTTQAGAQSALDRVDHALNTVTDGRAAMGAYQNRFNAAITNLSTSTMNLQASRSRILDADYATETTNLAKSQIITQAATAMLAQANQSSQSVLALLK